MPSTRPYEAVRLTLPPPPFNLGLTLCGTKGISAVSGIATRRWTLGIRMHCIETPCSTKPRYAQQSMNGKTASRPEMTHGVPGEIIRYPLRSQATSKCLASHSITMIRYAADAPSCLKHDECHRRKRQFFQTLIERDVDPLV